MAWLDVAMVAVLAIALTYGTNVVGRLVGVITLADLGRSGVSAAMKALGGVSEPTDQAAATKKIEQGRQPCSQRRKLTPHYPYASNS